MGILFSRASGDLVSGVSGSHPAGAFDSANETNIAPFLGINTGSYYGLDKSTAPPIPFEWIVSPLTVSPGQCSNGSTMLLVFGITDITTACLSIIFANQHIVRRLSFGRLGMQAPLSIGWTWSIYLALQLIANATIAAMVGRTPGFEKLNMLHIFTLYSARPRANTLVLAVLRSTVGVRKARSTVAARGRGPESKDEFPYADAYIGSMAAELTLQIIAAIFTGVTWGRLPGGLGSAKEYMGPVVQFAKANPGALAFAGLILIPIYRRRGEAFPISGWVAGSKFRSSDSRTAPRPSAKSIAINRFGTSLLAVLFVGFTYLIQFDYFTQFLELPGVL